MAADLEPLKIAGYLHRRRGDKNYRGGQQGM
jgi:hypothetical protein